MKTLLAALLVITGCASSQAHFSDQSHAVSVLTVKNLRGEDATIYVMHAGIRGRRLGDVTSFSSATFVITQSDAPGATDVQFAAKATITGMTELSDRIAAASGASYEWKLGPGRDYGFLTLHYAGR
jgi:hypothetical protein